MGNVRTTSRAISPVPVNALAWLAAHSSVGRMQQRTFDARAFQRGRVLNAFDADQLMRTQSSGQVIPPFPTVSKYAHTFVKAND